MTAALVPYAADVPLTVCRVHGSTAAHLVRELSTGPETEALCGGSVTGLPERTLVNSPCRTCVRAADEQGLRAVRDLTSAWVNLRRLAACLRAAA